MQIGQVAQLRRDIAAQRVSIVVKFSQGAQVAQFRRNAAGQLVATELEALQIGQVAQLRWDGTGQFVTTKVNLCHPAAAAGDTEPRAGYIRDLPIGEVQPTTAIDVVIKGFQRSAFNWNLGHSCVYVNWCSICPMN
jgi:hypothetical protein